jgi:hypothetical protein
MEPRARFCLEAGFHSEMHPLKVRNKTGGCGKGLGVCSEKVVTPTILKEMWPSGQRKGGGWLPGGWTRWPGWLPGDCTRWQRDREKKK